MLLRQIYIGPRVSRGSMAMPLRDKIAGEIVLSDAPGKTMRKWREELHISQTDLARHMRVSPSVISDYEAGRRTSPGIKTIRRLVDAFLEIDRTTGRRLSKRFEEYSDAIPSMRDWPVGMRASDFLRKIEGTLLTSGLNARRLVNGYTVIDSIKAITTFDANDYLRIYGATSERALLFTGVKYGRSPMIAVKAHPLKPAMVIYVKPENIDELAIKLAELENILLARTDLEVQELIERLERLS
jgi:putative transcriptional regulator